jgi:thioesterase domain-containing protein
MVTAESATQAAGQENSMTNKARLAHEVARWLHNHDNSVDALAWADALAATHGFRKRATRKEVRRQIAQAQHEWRDADAPRETNGWHPESWLHAAGLYAAS